ncbi:MAG: hypothetical protein P8J93_00260 [SAR86 cluster bacterium]|jgi:hypothetical protein|nr:hypothetical protein [SAR86 cluster bacterium]|tara:strand:- start:5754 stop:5981 length:228 start_codon:yes stop_codon:yes gene_type:complete
MKLKTVLLILIFFIGIVLSLSLIYLNDSFIKVDLLFYSFEDVSLGKVILYAFLLGSGITFLIELLLKIGRNKEVE